MKIALPVSLVLLLLGWVYYDFIWEAKPVFFQIGSEPVQIEKSFQSSGFVFSIDKAETYSPKLKLRIFFENFSEEPLDLNKVMTGKRFGESVVLSSGKPECLFEGRIENLSHFVLSAYDKEVDLNFSVRVESDEKQKFKFRMTPLPKPFF